VCLLTFLCVMCFPLCLPHLPPSPYFAILVAIFIHIFICIPLVVPTSFSLDPLACLLLCSLRAPLLITLCVVYFPLSLPCPLLISSHHVTIPVVIFILILTFICVVAPIGVSLDPPVQCSCVVVPILFAQMVPCSV